MNAVVCSLRRCDQVLRIGDPLLGMDYVVNSHRIHVMDEEFCTDLVTRNTKITAVVSDYDVIPGRKPLSGSVKSLIEPTIKPERGLAYATAEF